LITFFGKGTAEELFLKKGRNPHFFKGLENFGAFWFPWGKNFFSLVGRTKGFSPALGNFLAASGEIFWPAMVRGFIF